MGQGRPALAHVKEYLVVELLKPFYRNMEEKNPPTETPAKAEVVLRAPAGRVAPQYLTTRSVALDLEFLENNRCVGLLPEAPEHEAYKKLRIQIGQRMRANHWNTLMVTSLHPGEGKTLTAINLAAMFAREYQRTVLLVDADLRRQPIQAMLGYHQDKGLVDHLLDGYPVRDILVWPQVEKLTLISGGRKLYESAELLGSPQMAAFVEEIKGRYDDRLIIFDTPALMDSADTMAFAPLVDAIAIVVAAGRTALADVRAALGTIPREKVVGFVMNHQR
jgi:non-specific protein-tyrosine kinase